MNNWKLRSTITGKDGMDLVEVNGHISSLDSGEDCLVQVQPHGETYPYFLRTSASEDLGPVPNQVPGICNGTFTHTGAASGTVSGTVIDGQGTGSPTFTYTFVADGTLSTIVAATSGGDDKIRVGDKYQITTNEGHVIQFRLVNYSNARLITIRLIYNQGVLPFSVHRVRITESTDHTIQVLDYRSSQVFPKPQNKLLDKYPDAAAAYSFRKLRSAYLGPAIRVRIPQTNDEKDIYFDGQGNLDTATLEAFAGTYQTIRIRTWYDQSGAGNDLDNTTTAQQAIIYSSGALLTDDDGQVYANCADAQYSLGATIAQPFTALAVAQLNAYSRLTFSPLWSPDNQKNRANFGAELRGLSAWSAGEKYLYGVLGNGSSSELRLNGLQDNEGSLGTNSLTSSTKIFTQTQPSSAGAPRAYEMVIWDSDQSANFDPIEKDMGLHYKTQGMEDAPLLDAYGGAHAAYSLRKLNSDYTGAAIRVRRNSDSAELDVGFDADGNLDIAVTDAFYDGSNMQVKTWYDQSGNGNDTTRNTGSAQPLLYNNVGLLKIDGRPGLRFVGNDGMYFDNTGLDIGNLSSFAVMKYTDASAAQEMGLALSSATNNKRWYAPYLNGGLFNYGYTSNSSAMNTTANTNNNLHTMIAGATQGDAEAFLNGSSVGTATLGSGIHSSAGIGFLSTQFYMDGFIQEIVVYSSDQSERREGIERNISNHYDL